MKKTVLYEFLSINRVDCFHSSLFRKFGCSSSNFDHYLQLIIFHLESFLKHFLCFSYLSRFTWCVCCNIEAWPCVFRVKDTCSPNMKKAWKPPSCVLNIHSLLLALLDVLSLNLNTHVNDSLNASGSRQLTLPLVPKIYLTACRRVENWHPTLLLVYTESYYNSTLWGFTKSVQLTHYLSFFYKPCKTLYISLNVNGITQ